MTLKLHATGSDCFESNAFKEMKGLKVLKLRSVSQ